MLKVTMLALGASLMFGAVAADDAAAQSGRDRAEAAKRGTVIVPQDRDRDVVVRDRDRDGRNDRDWDDDDRWDDRNGKNKKGKGPKFCQNGQGHPVHGRAWCRQKGYDTGYGMYDRVDWGDVVLRRGRYDTRRDMSRSTLENILGSVVLGRFDRQRSRLGYNQPLYGRWVDSDAGSVLRVLSGNQPIAQVIDRNRDGRADLVLLYNGR
jgi:hypothetical protein